MYTENLTHIMYTENLTFFLFLFSKRSHDISMCSKFHNWHLNVFFISKLQIQYTDSFYTNRKKKYWAKHTHVVMDKSFVCVEVLPPSQPNGVMLSVVSLPNHFYWAAMVL